jgi:hypothetical protein
VGAEHALPDLTNRRDPCTIGAESGQLDDVEDGRAGGAKDCLQVT